MREGRRTLIEDERARLQQILANYDPCKKTAEEPVAEDDPENH